MTTDGWYSENGGIAHWYRWDTLWLTRRCNRKKAFLWGEIRSVELEELQGRGRCTLCAGYLITTDARRKRQ